MIRAVLASSAVPLTRLERNQRARSGLHDITSHLDARVSLDDRQPCTFAHLMVAELLTGCDADDDRPCPVNGLENSRRTGSLRCFDLRQVPGLHRGDPRA